MDDIDHIIKEIVRRFFQEEGHKKISARTIAKKGNIHVFKWQWTEVTDTMREQLKEK